MMRRFALFVQFIVIITFIIDFSTFNKELLRELFGSPIETLEYNVVHYVEEFVPSFPAW